MSFGTPSEIPLEEATVWGLRCLRARELMVQEGDSEGALWATRGMWTYRLGVGDECFRRQFRVQTGFSPYGLLRFSPVRRLTGFAECLELAPHPDGAFAAISMGRARYRGVGESRFRESLKLRQFGLGVGSGISPAGPTRTGDGGIVFGEYFRNRERGSVRIYASSDGGSSWRVAHEFEPGRVKHIHIVREDPYTGDVWVGTGDKHSEAMVLRTQDAFASLEPIRPAGPRFRTIAFAFTRQAVYWGTDTRHPGSFGIYRFDRASGEIAQIAVVPELFFFGTKLASETVVISTCRNGDRFQTDAITRLWLLREGSEPVSVPCGKWAGGRYGVMRLARGQDRRDLALTCLNLEECGGDLLVFEERTLIDAASDYVGLNA